MAKLARHVSDAVRGRFSRALEAKAEADRSAEAGRRYVAAYVDDVHFVEGVHRSATGAPNRYTHDGTRVPSRSPAVSADHGAR